MNKGYYIYILLYIGYYIFDNSSAFIRVVLKIIILITRFLIIVNKI